jgi:endogenous inhibitor of DNA gyrase (YacG/DUF329 family)
MQKKGICKVCGKEFKYNDRYRPGTYCSNKCHGLDRKLRESVKCSNCGKEREVYEWERKQSRHGSLFFCSSKCYGEYRKTHWGTFGSDLANWKDGKGNEPYPLGFTGMLKERIRDRDGRCCRLCGKSESDLGQKLSIHHIDYDKDNLAPSNLVSLCRADNARVNYNRKSWEELFRKLLGSE